MESAAASQGLTVATSNLSTLIEEIDALNTEDAGRSPATALSPLSELIHEESVPHSSSRLLILRTLKAEEELTPEDRKEVTTSPQVSCQGSPQL